MVSENILKHFLFRHTSDRQLLRNTRLILFAFGGVVLWFALHSHSSIFEMVEEAYEVTLAGAFVPLAFGLYWKRANNQGATLSIILGIGTWLLMKNLYSDSVWPPQLIGLLASTTGMVTGSLLPNIMGKSLPQQPEHAALHHHAAAHTGHVAERVHRHPPGHHPDS
jgi:Na+/proline symporter